MRHDECAEGVAREDALRDAVAAQYGGEDADDVVDARGAHAQAQRHVPHLQQHKGAPCMERALAVR